MYGQASKYVRLFFIENVHAGSVGRNPGVCVCVWGGGGGTPIQGQYGYVPRERLRTVFFSTWAAPKDPPFKNIQFFVPFFRPGQFENALV